MQSGIFHAPFTRASWASQSSPLGGHMFPIALVGSGLQLKNSALSAAFLVIFLALVGSRKSCCNSCWANTPTPSNIEKNSWLCFKKATLLSSQFPGRGLESFRRMYARKSWQLVSYCRWLILIFVGPCVHIFQPLMLRLRQGEGPSLRLLLGLQRNSTDLRSIGGRPPGWIGQKMVVWSQGAR